MQFVMQLKGYEVIQNNNLVNGQLSVNGLTTLGTVSVSNEYIQNQLSVNGLSTLNQTSISSQFTKNNSLIVRQENTAYLIPKQNIHVMDKQYLLSSNFDNLIEELCRK